MLSLENFAMKYSAAWPELLPDTFCGNSLCFYITYTCPSFKLVENIGGDLVKITNSQILITVNC
jgi:hypothetical protein